MGERRLGGTPYATADAERALAALRDVEDELHTMSQPMTALLYSLEIGSMIGTMDGYAGAVREGLVQCHRLMGSLAAMRAAIAGTADPSLAVPKIGQRTKRGAVQGP